MKKVFKNFKFKGGGVLGVVVTAASLISSINDVYSGYKKTKDDALFKEEFESLKKTVASLQKKD